MSRRSYRAGGVRFGCQAVRVTPMGDVPTYTPGTHMDDPGSDDAPTAELPEPEPAPAPDVEPDAAPGVEPAPGPTVEELKAERDALAAQVETLSTKRVS